MKIQYISDLHLEHQTSDFSTFLEPVAPYLALCGDICIPELPTYKIFLEWCSFRWSKIFLITGNHEYYNRLVNTKHTMNEKNILIKSLVPPNVIFLNCESYWLEDEKVRIFGCTLWSEIDDLLLNKITDYMVGYQDIVLTGQTTKDIYYDEKRWLKEELLKYKKDNCLVLTHYMPSFKLINPRYKLSTNVSCFASNCEDLFTENIVGWICGHSHHGLSMEIKGIPFRMNAWGYEHEAVATRDRKSVLDIKSRTT